jgi:hypothetical protein
MSENKKRISPTGLILTAPLGKYKVVGVDRFSGEDWEHGTYDDKNKAIEEAVSLTKESLEKISTDPSITTVYYAYDDRGDFLGGGFRDAMKMLMKERGREL